MMKQFFHVISFEWKCLRRSSLLKALPFVTLGAGIYGIYFGKFEIDKQRNRIAQVEQYEKQHFDSLMHWATLDTTISEKKEKFKKAVSPIGVGWNKHFTYYEVNDPPVLSGLCLGQRDLFSVYYGFNVSTLHKQIYVGELANPMKLLTGNFDLSYVIVFLLPLLVVALFYNLYAAEEEGGTLPLLRSLPVTLFFTLLCKGLLRFMVIILLATFMLLLAFLLQGISVIEHSGLFIQWLLLIYGYCLFWSVIMGGVVGLRKGSALSAMLGLGLWLIFTLVTPAIINLSVSASETLPKRSETIHAIRNLNDTYWEAPKSLVFDQFYALNPEYNKGDTTDFYKWYYASFTLLDSEAKALNEKFEKQVAARNEMLDRWQWLAPAAMVHEKLSAIAKTDRESHMVFLQKVEAFHTELKELYYPRIFSGELFSMDDLQELERKL